MTISSTARKAGPFSGTGAQTAFPFGFKVFAASDVLVVQTDTQGIETPLTLTAQYSVALNADQNANPGGTVTLLSAPPAGYLVTIASAVAPTQGSSIPNNGGFYPKVIEQALDKLTILAQQTAEVVSRSVRFALSDSNPSGALPTATVRAGKFLAFDAGGNPTAASGTGADAALRTDLSSLLSGSALIAFIQGWFGSIGRTVQDKLREQISITDFGAKTTSTAAQNGVAIRNALAAAAATKGVLWVPGGTFQFDYITPLSDVVIDGVGTLQQAQTGATQGGITKPAGGGPLSNFHVRNISFDGARVANPGYVYNAIISIEAGAGEVVSNISFENLRMQDAQDHFIRVVATDPTGQVQNVRVDRCQGATTSAKRSLGGTASGPVSMDLARFEQTWDYTTNGNGYGATPNFKHIWITNCYAESIRTLADIKRGASHFTIAECHTKNMYDCHHSVDGSFYGTISDNVCEVESTYTGASTFTDFIEVQGEHIDISGNVCTGGGLVNNGIFVTDYGRPQEPNNTGHRSIGVILHDNHIKDIKGSAYRVLNGVNCAIVDNEAENLGAHICAIESGTGRTDGTNPLVAAACKMAGNSSRNATLGAKFQGTGHVKGINLDENGQDFLYCPGLALADTYANFLNEGGYVNLNPNSLLEINSALPAGTVNNNLLWTDADYYPNAVAAASRPLNAANAVTLSDEVTNAIRTIYCAAHVTATVNQRVYARVEIKKNTSSNCGLLVQEYDANGNFLSNTFYGTNQAPVAWTAYLIGHKVANANTAYIRIGLMPGSSANDPTTTGTTDFANWRIARIAIGR